MPIKWSPRVVYNSPAVTIDFKFAQRSWESHSRGTGGEGIADSGVQEAFLRRWDEFVDVTLVFFEDEWAAVGAWLKWAQTSGQSFTFRFDQTDAATVYTVYLDRPRLKESIKPTRNREYLGALQIDLTFRTAAGGMVTQQIIPPSVPVNSIVVTPDAFTIQNDETQVLTADVRDAGNNVLADRVVVWLSSNPTVASVDTTGPQTAIVRGMANMSGSVTITAMVEGKVDQSAATIVPVVVTVTVTPDPFELDSGLTQQMTAVARDAIGNIVSGVTFTWLSSDPTKATVNASGLVTGVLTGTTAIRATAPNAVFGEADGTISGDINLPPSRALVIEWAHDPLLQGSAQTGACYVGPNFQRGSTSGVDGNDPTHVAGPPAHDTFEATDYIDFGNWGNAELWNHADGFTIVIAVDVQAGELGGLPMIVTKDDAGAQYVFRIMILSSLIYMYVILQGGGRDGARTNDLVAAGKHTYFITYDRSLPFGSRLKFYIDGVLKAHTEDNAGGDGAVHNGTAALRQGMRAAGDLPGLLKQSFIYAWPGVHTQQNVTDDHNWIVTERDWS